MQDGKKLPTVNSFCDDVILPSLKNSETAVRLAPSLMSSHHITAQLQSKSSGRLVLFDTRSAHAIDSDDCEEIDAEEDAGDDYVVLKRNEAKKPRSKRPKGNFTMYSLLESTRPVYKDSIAFKSTIRIQMCTYMIAFLCISPANTYICVIHLLYTPYGPSWEYDVIYCVTQCRIQQEPKYPEQKG